MFEILFPILKKIDDVVGVVWLYIIIQVFMFLFVTMPLLCLYARLTGTL